MIPSYPAITLLFVSIAGSWRDLSSSNRTLAPLDATRHHCMNVCKAGTMPCLRRERLTRHDDDSPVTWREVQGVTPQQRRFLRRNPDLVTALVRGHRLGVRHCATLFRNARWNCHAIGQHRHFGHVQVKHTKEAAVMYALQSAGMTYTVYQACKKGALPSCRCGDPRGLHRRAGWQWDGCVKGMLYSARKVRRFLRLREIEKDARSLMNQHNNLVGIKEVSRSIRERFRCVDPSGSCKRKTHWREAPSTFYPISSRLAERLANAVLAEVAAVGGPLTVVTGNCSDVPVPCPDPKVTRPKRRQLVYLEPSPSYCEPDPNTGFPGTKNRPCHRSKTAVNSCRYLCCGRGYNTRVEERQVCCRYSSLLNPTTCRRRVRMRYCK